MSSNHPLDIKLYNKIKSQADKIYKKPSAYKSGYIVKEYKKQGGKYSGTKTTQGLTRWYKEDWKDVGGKSYPVYRPTKRINKKTPLLASEIKKKDLEKKIKQKQKIKGSKNLSPFEGKY
jgi:hypothetical protein